MLRRERQLRRLVYVAFVVGVAVLVTVTTQLSSLWADGVIPASRQHVSCKFSLIYVRPSNIVTYVWKRMTDYVEYQIARDKITKSKDDKGVTKHRTGPQNRYVLNIERRLFLSHF